MKERKNEKNLWYFNFYNDNNPFSLFFNIAKLYVMAELRHTQK